MKALAVKQPWSYAICDGSKTIEVRSWATKYRGPLLICASASPKDVFWDQYGDGSVMRQMHAGCAIGIVELADCRPMKRADNGASMGAYAAGAYAWVMEPIGFVQPTALKCKLNLFEVSDDLIIRLGPFDEEWLFDHKVPQGVVPFNDKRPVFG